MKGVKAIEDIIMHNFLEIKAYLFSNNPRTCDSYFFYWSAILKVMVCSGTHEKQLMHLASQNCMQQQTYVWTILTWQYCISFMHKFFSYSTLISFFRIVRFLILTLINENSDKKLIEQSLIELEQELIKK